MAFYSHIFILVATLSLAVILQVPHTQGYTTTYPINGSASATIRLLQTENYDDDSLAGLIEVKVGDEWGPLCGVAEFSYREGKVACKQLGYYYDRIYGYAQHFYDIEEKYYDVAFYIGLSCNGYEDSLSKCEYSVLRGSADSCDHGRTGERGYAGVVCDKNEVIVSEENSYSFNYFAWFILAAIFFTIAMVIRRYRHQWGLCNNRQQMADTAVHTTNNMQEVVIPPPHPPGTYPTQPQENYQYQQPSINTPLVQQYDTGIPPKDGAPQYQAHNYGNPYQQVAPYEHGGTPYPSHGVGTPFPPQSGSPYPPQPADSAPYPPQGGAPYPQQPTDGVPYQAQEQGASAPPQGCAPTSVASAPAFNPAFPPADYIPDANNAVPAMPPPSYESAVEQ